MKYTYRLISLALLAIVISGFGGCGRTTADNTTPSEPGLTDVVIEAVPTTPQAEVKEFSIIAKNWEFQPSTITVKQGDLVRLKVKSVDAEHSLAIPDYQIDVNLPPNEEKTVEFVADQVGTFKFRCAVFCGEGHKAMTGQLIVQ